MISETRSSHWWKEVSYQSSDNEEDVLSKKGALFAAHGQQGMGGSQVSF